MTVAIVGKFYTEGFGLHIEEALLKLDHDVIRVDPEVNLPGGKLLTEKMRSVSKTLYQQVFHKIEKIRKLKSKEIYNLVSQRKVDLTIVLHDFLTREEVKEIKRITKSPVVLWFPDHISNIQKAMFFVADYDFLFFKDHYMVDRFRKEYGLNTRYLSQCCNPNKHNLVQMTESERKFYQCDITNAGNLYPSRAALYKRLTKYNIKLWGSPPAIWLNVPELNQILMNDAVYNEKKCKAFSAAKIVLNNMHPAEINGVNKRTFEVAACGGFQITNYTEALEEFYVIDKEVVVYNNYDELIEKIEFYLDDKNASARQEIINAGYQRSISDHTYEKRMNQMLKIVFGN